MLFLHHNFIFEVKRDWWVEAGMQGFVPNTRSYSGNPESFPDKKFCEVSINEIAPVLRELSDGVFNDDSVRGITAKDRAIQILQRFSGKRRATAGRSCATS